MIMAWTYWDGGVGGAAADGWMSAVKSPFGSNSVVTGFTQESAAAAAAAALACAFFSCS